MKASIDKSELKGETFFFKKKRVYNLKEFLKEKWNISKKEKHLY